MSWAAVPIAPPWLIRSTVLWAATRPPRVEVVTVRARSTDRRDSSAVPVKTSSSSTTHRYCAAWASGANGDLRHGHRGERATGELAGGVAELRSPPSAAAMRTARP